MTDNIEVIITSEEAPGIVVENTTEVSVIVTEGSQGPKGAQGPQGIPGASSINRLTDVDVNNVQDGSLLVYKQQTQKWTASIDLSSQSIDAGNY